MSRYSGHRYIRTEDKILDTELNDYDVKIISEYIIKEADTIEELCDVFVIIRNGNPYMFNGLQKCFLSEFKFEKNDIVYGAIWTGEELIIVAKMNKDGDLELI